MVNIRPASTAQAMRTCSAHRSPPRPQPNSRPVPTRHADGCMRAQRLLGSSSIGERLMARRKRSSSSNRRPQAALAPKLIGVGVLLAIVPLVLGNSPLAAGLRPLAPLGWLLLAVGCALLWWQIKEQRAKAPAVSAPDLTTPAKPFHRASVARPPVLLSAGREANMARISRPTRTHETRGVGRPEERVVDAAAR